MCTLCPTMQISDQAQIKFEEIVRNDRIVVDMGVTSEPMSLTAYVEDCRIKL